MKKNGKNGTNGKTTTSSKPEIVWKKNMAVKFCINTGYGMTKGKGVVVALPPPNPGRGMNRVTVKDSDGKEWHPYTTQVTPVTPA